MYMQPSDTERNFSNLYFVQHACCFFFSFKCFQSHRFTLKRRLQSRCFTCPTTFISHSVSSLLGALQGAEAPNQPGRRTPRRRQHQTFSRCWADHSYEEKERRGGGERKPDREGEARGAQRKHELSMCCEQMENNYFMVIVWCLIRDCIDELLILAAGWIFH